MIQLLSAIGTSISQIWTTTKQQRFQPVPSFDHASSAKAANAIAFPYGRGSSPLTPASHRTSLLTGDQLARIADHVALVVCSDLDQRIATRVSWALQLTAQCKWLPPLASRAAIRLDEARRAVQKYIGMVERLGDAQLCTAAKGEGLESLLAPEYLFLRQNKLGR